MSCQFTVGIPTHDRRETVLLAVRSALQQTRPPARVCVIADGCTDGTQEAVRELGDEQVEVIDLPKAPGYGYAHRNAVLERARGQAVAWLADDDLWMPDHLERAGELLDAGAEIVNSMACVVAPDGSLSPFGVHWRAPTYRDRFLGIENRTPSSAVSHLADLGRDVGGWAAEVEHSGDWDLWQRIVRAGARNEMVLTPTVLFFRASERQQSWPERVAQNTAFLSRMRDRVELGRLRAELAFACAAGAHAELSAARGHAAALEAHRDALQADRDNLRVDRDAIVSSTWWRLRERLEPALRVGRALRRRT
jgi:glycosyltransferase involved in cell wall biosynthesis